MSRSLKINAEEIKEQAIKLGADLVGVCLAQTLNESPPDPKWPQVPGRIWKNCRSVIVLAKKIPWGMFHAEGELARQSTPQLVMNRLDSIALDLVYYIEKRGFHALPVPQQQTDSELKKGTYGPLSLRHVAVEAGLGTLGLNLFLLTTEYGPRVYLTAVLTDAEIEPDRQQEKKLCLGPSCGRCLLVCPGNAVEHWGLDKRRCSAYAQQHGVSALFTYLDKVVAAETSEERKSLFRSLELVELWQAVRTGAGAVGACPRCLEVCPVGEDYIQHLKEQYTKVDGGQAEQEKLEAMRLAEREGKAIPGFEISQRWIGRGSS